MKTISKANEKFYSLLQKAVEINDDPLQDYDTREGYICANIKVYEWLNSSDVEEHVKTLNLTPDEIELINEEFDEERLNSIYYHTCEMEVEYIKDFIGGCAHTNFNKAKRAFNYAKNETSWPIELKFYFTQYAKQFEQYNTIADFIKYLESEHAQEYAEFYHLQNLDEKNVWQFGRSGGWLSVAKKEELENFCQDAANLYWYLEKAYNADDNTEFNRILMEHAYRPINVADAREELTKNIQSDIESFEEKKAAIDWIINYIEEGKKYFKDTLTDRLTYEIDDFVNQYFDIEIQIQKYLSGKRDAINFIKEIEGEKIVTNFGAKVLIKDAVKFIQAIKNKVNVIGQKIGPYTINKVLTEQSKTFVKIGCHIFNLESTENQLNELKLI
jgi:hypothetical protein